jgi:dipeptidyl aminopeptidase/acylaminoacyl peptidase
MHRIATLASICLGLAIPWGIRAEPGFDAAAAFGSLPSVLDMSMSPDGKNVSYIGPAGTGGSMVYLATPGDRASPRAAKRTEGRAERIYGCGWVADDRLVCTFSAIAKSALGPIAINRIFSFNTDGSNVQMLSKGANEHSRGEAFGGGYVLDWLPDEDGTILMVRENLPDDRLGTRLGSTAFGVGVDRIDTRTLKSTVVEEANPRAVGYMSDGRGVVRVMILDTTRNAGDRASGTHDYLYRRKGSRDWKELAAYDSINDEGFLPLAIDSDLDVAYGLRKRGGRFALYTIALDGSLKEQLVYARDDVDVSGVARIGRRGRVVGATYATEAHHIYYTDAGIQNVFAGLHRALPGDRDITIVDSSVDESKLLVLASSDKDAGVYYIFDRATRQLDTFLVVRPELEKVALATRKAISYPAADGVRVPAYLTMPVGREDAKGLPAIVLPHGGPGARDVGGFDWLSQYFAARGYAVLQPNFRGSTGYGDAWFEHNGLHSWRSAIGDVVAAGRWLAKQGIADPDKLAVVGWSYGGYAALQSAVLDPDVYKAVVAIAPVTDLELMKYHYQNSLSSHVLNQLIGEGPEVREGSPAAHADKIKVPVLLVHGTYDVNVAYEQSEAMDRSLTRAGVRHEFITYDKLDHSLYDSSARTDLFRRSDAFLREALGIRP